MIPRRTMNPARAAAWLALLLVAAGCGTKVKNVDQAGDFDAATLARGKIALGGAMLGPHVELGRAAGSAEPAGAPGPLAQAERFAPVLYREFLTARPDLVVWPFATVGAQADTVVLRDLLQDWAAGRVMQPQRIRDLGAALAGASFLALARIDRNEIATEMSAAAADAAQQSRDGREVHESGMLRGGTTKRRVTVSLELYDLGTGWLAWSGTAEAEGRELFDFGASAPQDKVVIRKDEAGGPAAIVVPGSPLHAPELEDVFGDACRALIGKLPGAAPRRN